MSPEPLTQADLPVGTAVVYRAWLDAPAEDGVVTGHSLDPLTVFVRYARQHPGAPGQATRLADLTPTTPPTT